jgi:hypothetical protein
MAKKQYVSPSSVCLSGGENDYGAVIGIGVFWLIGIGVGWGWIIPT